MKPAMKLPIYLSLFASFLAGCIEGPPVKLEDANVYEKAVYFNNNRPYADRKRDVERKPAEILAFSGIKPGAKVVDLLGGGGWYTEILSELVGKKGHVYIVNPPLFTHIAGKDLTDRLDTNRLKNVTRLDVPWNDLQLPTEIDAIVLALSYHDIYVKRPKRPHFEANTEHFFQQLQLALKPEGRLLLTDHAAVIGSGISAAGKQHRIDEEFAKKDFEKQGFRLIKTTDILRNPNDNYALDIWNKAVKRKTDRFVHLYQRTTDTLTP